MHLCDLGLSIVLKHLETMTLMISEAACAKRDSVVKAEVDKLLLVLCAEVSISLCVTRGDTDAGNADDRLVITSNLRVKNSM